MSVGMYFNLSVTFIVFLIFIYFERKCIIQMLPFKDIQKTVFLILISTPSFYIIFFDKSSLSFTIYCFFSYLVVVIYVDYFQELPNQPSFEIIKKKNENGFITFHITNRGKDCYFIDKSEQILLKSQSSLIRKIYIKKDDILKGFFTIKYIDEMNFIRNQRYEYNIEYLKNKINFYPIKNLVYSIKNKDFFDFSILSLVLFISFILIAISLNAFESGLLIFIIILLIVAFLSFVDKLNKNKDPLIALLIPVSIVILLYCANFRYGFSSDSDDWGNFGSYFNGLIGPTLNFVMIVLFLRQLKKFYEQVDISKSEHEATREEFRLIRKQYEKNTKFRDVQMEKMNYELEKMFNDNKPIIKINKQNQLINEGQYIDLDLIHIYSTNGDFIRGSIFSKRLERGFPIDLSEHMEEGLNNYNIIYKDCFNEERNKMIMHYFSNKGVPNTTS
ncbi:MAG: hypothetical protein GY760_02195 [Deltaproteobacteria bacterium]|nr:hypothetical protein [Deltaproteobacteria bacterium]